MIIKVLQLLSREASRAENTQDSVGNGKCRLKQRDLCEGASSGLCSNISTVTLQMLCALTAQHTCRNLQQQSPTMSPIVPCSSPGPGQWLGCGSEELGRICCLCAGRGARGEPRCPPGCRKTFRLLRYPGPSGNQEPSLSTPPWHTGVGFQLRGPTCPF